LPSVSVMYIELPLLIPEAQEILLPNSAEKCYKILAQEMSKYLLLSRVEHFYMLLPKS